MAEKIKLQRGRRKSHTSHRQARGLHKQSHRLWMNDVSDALSRDNNRSDNELINVFRSFTPSQISDHFKIVPLPREISSWMISLLQRLPMKEQLREGHTRTKLGRGQGGKSTADQLELLKMSSSTNLPEANESESWEPLP